MERVKEEESKRWKGELIHELLCLLSFLLGVCIDFAIAFGGGGGGEVTGRGSWQVEMADSDNESGGGEQGGGGRESSPKEQDRFLPIANVSRIMKKALPANAKISKDAKETVQECVSEFISFITGEASDKCQREKRKTINGDDLLWAMTTLGFEDYVDPLKVYLQKFREMEGEKSSLGRGEGGLNEGGGTVQNGYGGGGSGVYGSMPVMMVGQNPGGIMYEQPGRMAGGYQMPVPGKAVTPTSGTGPTNQQGRSRG